MRQRSRSSFKRKWELTLWGYRQRPVRMFEEDGEILRLCHCSGVHSFIASNATPLIIRSFERI
jgi:hypothetical protein